MLDNYLKSVNIGKRKGVITTVKISKRTPICEFLGKIYTDKEISSLRKPDDVLQVGPNIYLGESGGLTDDIRHSCSPNCMIHVSGSRAILYSLYLIQPGTELTYDYSATSTDTLETWNMVCNCGSFLCRKNISGFYNLPEELQEKYKKEGIAAIFITSPIFARK